MYMRFHKYKIEIKLKIHVLRVWEVGVAASIIIFISVFYLHICIQVYLKSSINHEILQVGESLLNICCFLQLYLYIYIMRTFCI